MAAASSFVFTIMGLCILSAIRRTLAIVSLLNIRQFVTLLRIELQQDGAGYFFIISMMQAGLWLGGRWWALPPSIETGIHAVGCALATTHLSVVHSELERYARLVSSIRQETIISEVVFIETEEQEEEKLSS